MKNLPHYTKVITLGSNYTENALVGEVVVQEKVDGSQLRFGINEDKELLIGNRGVRIIPIEDDEELAEIASEVGEKVGDKARNLLTALREFDKVLEDIGYERG